MSSLAELTPAEFRQKWPAGEGVVLLDVREHAELQVASVEGVVHIPMGDVPARIRELDSGSPIVVMCHSGGRSRRVAEFLLRCGFSNVWNLAGGIDAWSCEIDPAIPRY